MRFKSLRTYVALLVGFCILSVVGALVAYSTWAETRSQQLVADHTGELLQQEAEQRLRTLAEANVRQIRQLLEEPLAIARNLASINALIGQKDEDGRVRLGLSRGEISNLVRDTVVRHPSLLDAYIGWEPNAFGQDRLYARQTEKGYAPSGRFTPWWYRTTDGNIDILPLGDTIESAEINSNGLRQGEYYLCSRETLSACIIDPSIYDYNGEKLLVTSFNAPILVDGEFRGVAGVDLTVDFLQGVLSKSNAGLYDGIGDMTLIASHGVVVASTEHPDSLGKLSANILDDEVREQVLAAQSGESRYHLDEATQSFQLYYPFVVGDDMQQHPWVLTISLPESAVLAGLHRLAGELDAQRQQDLWGMLMVGSIIAALGLWVSWWVGGSIARPLRHLAERMREIASGDGDLTQRLPVVGRNESAQLARGFNSFVSKINEVLREVRDNSESVRTAAAEIAMGGQDLSQRTENAAASLQQTSVSMEEITQTIQHTAESTQSASSLSRSATTIAHEGSQSVGRVTESIQELTEASRKVSEIVTVIDGIAFQTNLLSLNASIEAARAGEHGRGFAVVAAEVRQLASRSIEAANQIRELIESAQSRTDESAVQVSQAGQTMGDIVTSITRVSDLLGEISVATDEQRGGMGQMNVAVSELDRVTQQNASLVEESTTAARQLQQAADRLAHLVGGFTLETSDSERQYQGFHYEPERHEMSMA
ncbi:chemotaxis transducer [Halomonas cupida]|uniref:Chemotaxis transducer n=1 Tax=Halomonas cupida TaxID=44933 RepID=A0A1M7DCF4_9GAMM|nr:methyl-accepting chemotaxis protein [Halomonas cupida]GEN23174.1 chemotaxis transducer [Halomonas cupida]SHL77135.1 methyl-accepting chemotaxis protein [Halomonas cupida]